MKHPSIRAATSLLLAFFSPFLAGCLIAVAGGEFRLVADHLRVLSVAATYLLSACGLGCLLLRRIGDKDLSAFDRLAMALVMGLGVIYAISLAFGVAGVFRPLPILLMLVAGLAAAVFERRTIARLAADLVQGLAGPAGLSENAIGARAPSPPDPVAPRSLPPHRGHDLFERVFFCIFGQSPAGRVWRLWIVLALLLGVQFLSGFTPLVFDDAQIYHFYAPSEFLKHGSFVHLPWNVYTNSPMSFQLTTCTSLVLDRSGQAAKLLWTVFGCLLPLAGWRFLRAGSRAALPALMIASYPVFWVMQALGVLDTALAAFLLLGAAWFRDNWEEPSTARIVGAGLAFGFALASRYQGIVLVSWILVAVSLERYFQIRRWQPRAMLLAPAIAVLMLAPWIVRNYTGTGNAIFPLLYSRLGGGEWSTEQAGMLRMDVLGRGFQDLTAGQRALAPFGLLLPNPWNGVLGLGLVLCGLLALLAPRGSRLRLSAILGLGGLFFWSLLHPTPGPELMRFNSASLALLLAAAAGFLMHPETFQGRGVKAGLVLCAISLVFSVLLIREKSSIWYTFFDSGRRAGFEEYWVPGWSAFRAADQKLDPLHDKVLLIGETRGFWLTAPCISPSPFNGQQLAALFSPDADPPVWQERLKRLGITHLIVCRREWARLCKQYRFGLDSTDTKLNAWLGTLNVLYDDSRGNLLLSLDRGPGKK